MRMRIVLAAACVAMLATAGMAAGPANAAGATPVAGTVSATDTAGGTASATGAGPAGGYGPHRCYVSELAVGFRGRQAGLGNRGFLVTLTDVGGTSCRLDGYPGLELRDASWRPLLTRTRPGPTYFSPDPGRKLIVLSPGETASADISFGLAGQPSNSVLATYLQVTPPGSHRHFVLRIPSGAALVYRGELDVTALARHTPYFP